MKNRTCSVDGCAAAFYSRGCCRPHYRRLTKYGDPLGEKPEQPQRICDVEGCEKESRSRGSKLCKMHYHRQYRSGDVGEAEARQRSHRSEHCHIEGCFAPDVSKGLCQKHDARLRRHGDPHKVLSPDELSVLRRGEANGFWKGDDAGYTACHDRVRSTLGKASNHACVDCGGQAQHWSYDHDDLDERTQYLAAQDCTVAYSTKPEHYQPRCVPCHKRFDLDKINAARHNLAA